MQEPLNNHQAQPTSLNLKGLNLDMHRFLLPSKLARKHGMIVVEKRGEILDIAIGDPGNLVAQDEARMVTGHRVNLIAAQQHELDEALGQLYPNPTDVLIETGKGTVHGGPNKTLDGPSQLDAQALDRLVSGAVDYVEVVRPRDETEWVPTKVEPPIIKLVNGILVNAVKACASDVHFEPYDKAVRVRFRLDGVLSRVLLLPGEIRDPVIARVKVMASLDLAERRLPQDGRIRLKVNESRTLDFRVSTLPTLYGEKVVVRLLDRNSLQLGLQNLGFSDKSEADLKAAIRQPWGMILVTGPTGSGKTTTLYSALSELNQDDVNIMTAEDPIEYNLPGINQVQMHERIGLTFSKALRSFLRQDPDIIMVGEIRDYETAEIAVKSSLTGHLVFSTLHTNDAPSTVIRLIDMGVASFLVASSIHLVVAQRLVRTLCQACKEPGDPLSPLWTNVAKHMGKPPAQIWAARGCEACHQIGFKGRTALVETMCVNQGLRDVMVNDGGYGTIRAQAIESGMVPLNHVVRSKLASGMIAWQDAIGHIKELT